MTESRRWVFLVKKGYQEVDTAIQSSVITKVKGVAFTNTSELKERLWDVADYVIPSQGENVFFVVTNLIVTPNQRQSHCAEQSSRIPDAACFQDSDCPKGEAVISGNGVRTGTCLMGGSNSSGTCEVFAWCPVENTSKSEKPLLEKAEDFTVYIKNTICFPKFNFSKSNVLHTDDRSFLKSCRFGPENHYCPIFQLGTLVSYTGNDFQEMALEGGVIGIEIQWDCDLDRDASACNPQYSFSRLDNRFAERSISSGYNFRFAKYYRDADGEEFRTLMKVYGIRFDVLVNGKAGKFNIIPMIINVGTGMALMGAANLTKIPVQSAGKWKAGLGPPSWTGATRESPDGGNVAGSSLLRCLGSAPATKQHGKVAGLSQYEAHVEGGCCPSPDPSCIFDGHDFLRDEPPGQWTFWKSVKVGKRQAHQGVHPQGLACGQHTMAY
ncbi:P2X purinoceptor 5 isoform X3 [Petaurus breviceps papuanus]|uniref:P2X purinoceptor 5 isoform X3 n=1 Tax=Petaurus breviceps papuanus TaxID=3040969 RepID=UPI0036DE5423